MSKAKRSTIDVKGTAISIVFEKEADYICLTDIARYRDAKRIDYLIQNWLRNRNTIEFLGIWEQLNNPGFNPIEFDGIKKQSGLNSFILTAKQWVDKTGAIGLISKPGRYGGTYANEADILNVAIFGQTAKQWRDANPKVEGNMRDYASLEQLLVLANMESMNAELIHMGLSQGDRLKRLNEIAIRQMQVLASASAIKQLKE